ncbi:hypothetical protein P8C59_003763 [Phyllachora maydis]|uniref:peptidyl-tRNA hydrolase n=1 Tax=Phyllachora maydis TaxID=1825666 RepID=A0AAD9I224_9PEZI|nr:hypothetical protein P8C59_003763 [Phyllachora maydis]
MASRPQHVVVISLGNPPPLRHTLHSAGHLALEALVKSGLISNQPPFAKASFGNRKVLASVGPRYTLLQCPSQMNISGQWISRMWKADFMGNTKNAGFSPHSVGLVIVADDLEEQLGVVKIRAWSSSARGHNGIKSIQAAMKSPGLAPWARISIGVGRPGGRDHSTVSDYVLGAIPAPALEFLEVKSPDLVHGRMRELEQTWILEADAVNTTASAGS